MAMTEATSTKNTKARIRNAAMSLFKQKGFDVVTIDEICISVGITKPAFYYHYKSKQNIFDSFYDEVIEKTNSKMATMFSMSAYWQRLWIILELFVDHTELAGYDVITQILKYSLDGQNEILRKYFDSTSGVQIEIIKKGQARSEIRSALPAETLYELSEKIIFGTVVLWCMNQGMFNLKKTILKSLEALFDLKASLRTDE